MLVVDASCLFEVVVGTRRAEVIRGHIDDHVEAAAPHVIDVEVLNAIRRDHRLGEIDSTTAHQAVDDLCSWAGERYPHQPLIGRAWELRDNVRGWDAFYVALAEALDVPLLTVDNRLARATGPRCRFIVVPRELI